MSKEKLTNADRAHAGLRAEIQLQVYQDLNKHIEELQERYNDLLADHKDCITYKEHKDAIAALERRCAAAEDEMATMVKEHTSKVSSLVSEHQSALAAGVNDKAIKDRQRIKDKLLRNVGNELTEALVECIISDLGTDDLFEELGLTLYE